MKLCVDITGLAMRTWIQDLIVASFVCIYNVEKVTAFWVYFFALVLPK